MPAENTDPQLEISNPSPALRRELEHLFRYVFFTEDNAENNRLAAALMIEDTNEKKDGKNVILVHDQSLKQKWSLDKPVSYQDLRHLRKMIVKNHSIKAFEEQLTDFQLGTAYLVDPKNKALHSIKDKNQKIILTDKEIALLRHLIVTAGGQATSRQELLTEIWGYHSEAETHTLETHIYRLRQKLYDLTGREWIETVTGGYQIEKQNSK